MSAPYTDTTNAPKIRMEGYRYREPLSWFVVGDSGDPHGYHRTVGEANYEFRHLTYAAADSIAAAKAATSSPYTDSYVVTARWYRATDNGWFNVAVNEKIRGAWVADS